MTRRRPGPKPGTTVTVSHATRCVYCGLRYVLIVQHEAKCPWGPRHAP